MERLIEVSTRRTSEELSKSFESRLHRSHVALQPNFQASASPLNRKYDHSGIPNRMAFGEVGIRQSNMTDLGKAKASHLGRFSNPFRCLSEKLDRGRLRSDGCIFSSYAVYQASGTIFEQNWYYGSGQ